MKQPPKNWPIKKMGKASVVDMEVIENVCAINIDLSLFKFEKYSTLSRMVRFVAWMLRFIDRVRLKEAVRVGELTVDELD